MIGSIVSKSAPILAQAVSNVNLIGGDLREKPLTWNAIFCFFSFLGAAIPIKLPDKVLL
jgi:hypothetical protein